MHIFEENKNQGWTGGNTLMRLRIRSVASAASFVLLPFMLCSSFILGTHQAAAYLCFFLFANRVLLLNTY